MSDQRTTKKQLRPGIRIGALWFSLTAKPSRWDRFWVWVMRGWRYEERP